MKLSTLRLIWKLAGMSWDDAGGADRLPLLRVAIMLWDLLENPESKYRWAQQVSILLFRTIISEDRTGTQMRTPLELAQLLGMQQAALQLAVVQRLGRLCLSLFNEANPD